MSPIRLNKYLPDLAICAVALIPLVMGACSYKLGEPIRIYDSRDPAPAVKTAPSPTPGGLSGILDAAAKAEVKAPICAFQGGASLENNKNLSTLADLRQEVAAQASVIQDESDLREKIMEHAKTLGILDNKPELRKLYTDILAMPAIAPRTPSVTPSGRPSDLPGAALSGAITAFVIHKHVYELAVKPANAGGLDMPSDKAKALAEMLYRLPLETLAALKQALAFAQDKQNGLGISDLKPALVFCNRILKTSSPAQTIIAYINIYQRELLLSGTPEKAETEANKATCLRPLN